ncbi:MAG: RluA family pseudouridine synthase [Parvibaculum sp.]
MTPHNTPEHTLKEGQGQRLTLAVTDEDNGLRLDQFLTRALLRLEGDEALESPPSRSRVRVLLEDGQVETAATPDDPTPDHPTPRAINDISYRVKQGEVYRVSLPPPAPAGPVAENIPLHIIYEDSHLLVVNKPAGLVVHPAPGSPDGTLVNALLAHCGPDFTGIGGEQRPGIVHRLDKETSGLMVVAKTEPALKALQAQFASHGRDGRLERAYTAFVWGKPHPKTGTINAPLARSRHNRLKITVTRTAESDGAREAITHYRIEKSYGETPKDGTPLVSQITCHLETGRTHQIRVHMTHLGHPILGDRTYGTGQRSRATNLSQEAKKALEDLGRQALHAHLLGFEHPETKEKLVFECDLPPELARLHQTLELL